MRVLDCTSHESKFQPRTGSEGPAGEFMYSCTLSLTSALDGSVWVNATSQPLYTWEGDAVSIVQEAGWASGPVSKGVKNLAPIRIQPPDRPVCSQSLHPLCSPGPRYSWYCYCTVKNVSDNFQMFFFAYTL